MILQLLAEARAGTSGVKLISMRAEAFDRDPEGYSVNGESTPRMTARVSEIRRRIELTIRSSEPSDAFAMEILEQIVSGWARLEKSTEVSDNRCRRVVITDSIRYPDKLTDECIKFLTAMSAVTGERVNRARSPIRSRLQSIREVVDDFTKGKRDASFQVSEDRGGVVITAVVGGQFRRATVSYMALEAEIDRGGMAGEDYIRQVCELLYRDLASLRVVRAERDEQFEAAAFLRAMQANGWASVLPGPSPMMASLSPMNDPSLEAAARTMGIDFGRSLTQSIAQALAEITPKGPVAQERPKPIGARALDLEEPEEVKNVKVPVMTRVLDLDEDE